MEGVGRLLVVGKQGQPLPPSPLRLWACVHACARWRWCVCVCARWRLCVCACVRARVRACVGNNGRLPGRFDNSLYSNELADSPRSRLPTGGDSYSSVATPTVFDYSSNLPEVV